MNGDAKQKGSMRPIRLLTETETIEPLREAARGCTDLRIAVAFWGKGAVRTLGLARAKRGRMICNLESGACNPAEIRKLLRSQKLKIKTHSELHAKIYWTPEVAFVGSSNASANGLVLDADVAEGWREANIRFEDEVEIARAGRYFDRLWNEGRRITKRLLAEAEEKWKLRARASKALSVRSSTIFSAMAEDPTLFAGKPVYLAIYDGWASREAQAEGRKYKSDSQSAVKFDDGLVVRPDTLTVYESWRGLQAGAWLIDCSFVNPKKPKVFGMYRVWEGGKIKLKASSIQFAYRTKAVVLDGREFKLSAQERRTIENNASKLFQARSGRRTDLLDLTAVAKVCKLVL